MKNQKVILDDYYIINEENIINNFFHEIFINNKKHANIFDNKLPF